MASKLAQQISRFRQEAREKHGRESGAEMSWKLTANSIYGVSASKYLVTNNVVLSVPMSSTIIWSGSPSRI